MAAARSRADPRPGARHRPVRGDIHPERSELRAALAGRPRTLRAGVGAGVVVIRGDHVAELGTDANLAGLVERGLHLVTPLAGERLREAVEGPAKVAGLRLEPGLVDLLVRDADDQPGALPLLSHALTETWRAARPGC